MADKPSKSKAKKSHKSRIVGPLFTWELVRLARRGQDARGRFILAVSLFFILTFFTLIWFRNLSPSELFFGGSQMMRPAESASFGSSFAMTFLIAQLCILILMTPAYAAGGLAEEKEKKTLEFLLVSDLTNREIILGKFLGRVGFLLGILLAGLPILSIIRMHGGVSEKMLFMSYAITAGTVIMTSGISIAAAASATTYRGALFRSYGLTAIIVITGCGVGPWIGPLAVIPILGQIEFNSPEWFYPTAIGYTLGEVIVGILATYVAIIYIRRLRARLTARNAAPPPWAEERYRRDDFFQEQERKRLESLRLQQENERKYEELLKQNDAWLGDLKDLSLPATATNGEVPAEAERVPVAMVSPHSIIRPQSEFKRPKPERLQDIKKPVKMQMIHDSHLPPLPRIGNKDPFYWKERYTRGTVHTEDDDAMKSMMYLLGGVLALFVALVFLVSVLTMMGGSTNFSVARTFLVWTGGFGVFVYFLMIGSRSTGAICRERMRLTLESLLTIPEARSVILWPKWFVSFNAGWWWGLPSAMIMAIGFLASEAPIMFMLVGVYFLAAAPFAASYGLWLSIRCRSVNRAMMWFMPVAGGLVLIPAFISGWITDTNWYYWAGTLAMFDFALIACMSGLYYLSSKAFEQETILGPGRK